MSRQVGAEGASRSAGIDVVRAIGVALVVCFHAAAAYTETPIGWALQDRSRHLIADVFIWITNAALMPVFYLVAGHVARGQLVRHGLQGYIRRRATRILLPFAVLLWPTAQVMGALWAWGRDVAGGRPAVADVLPKIAGSGSLSLAHLWFLYYLLVITAVALVFVPASGWFSRPWRPQLARAASRAAEAGALPWLFAAPVAAVFGWTGALDVDTPQSLVVDPAIAGYYGAFFLWGWITHGRPEGLAYSTQHIGRNLVFAVALLLTLAAPLLEATRSSVPVSAALFPVSAAFRCLFGWALIGLCLRAANALGPRLRQLARASYVIYVVHLPLVVGMQILLADLPAPGLVKFVLVAAVGLLLPWSAFRVVEVVRMPRQKARG